jgi:tRNA(fMet)-specific endonuclease VapC
MILDTNAVSHLLDGDKYLGEILSVARSHHLPLVVVGEYLFGLRNATKGTRLQSLFRRLEAESEILFPDRQTADSYALIRFELKQLGRPIPEGDIWQSPARISISTTFQG